MAVIAMPTTMTSLGFSKSDDNDNLCISDSLVQEIQMCAGRKLL
jgi:hypothetical protein